MIIGPFIYYPSVFILDEYGRAYNITMLDFTNADLDKLIKYSGRDASMENEML